MTNETKEFCRMLWRNKRPDFPPWAEILSMLARMEDADRDALLEGLPGYPDRVAPYYELKKKYEATYATLLKVVEDFP